MNQLYRPSNKFTPQGVILGLAAGVAASLPLGFLYVYGLWMVDSVKLRGISPLAYGAAVGAVCGLAMCWGKVRSPFVAGIVGSVSGLFAWYFSWLVWLLHLIFPSFWIFNPMHLALHPGKIWQVVLEVNAKGTWGMTAGSPATGTWLWTIWLAELLCIVGFSAAAALALVVRKPFCERCQSWCSEISKLYFAPVVQPAEIKQRAESADCAWISGLAAGDKKKAHYRIDIHSCGTCHTLNTLTLVQNFPRNVKTLVGKLVLSDDQAATLRHMALRQSMQAGAAVSELSSTSK